jgi:hypothetical protein
MNHKPKKAATEKISEQSVQTNAAESSQEQPARPPDSNTTESVSNVVDAQATTTLSHPIAATKKMSLAEKQYLEAIALCDAELGSAIKKPTQIITEHMGSAIAHEELAKKDRADAQREFVANIAYYYEVKQRLLNQGYRTDVNGGKDRTATENEKNFGAPDWETFNENCAAYSLQHADRKLKAFAKANGLLTDGGDNIDDPDSDDIDDTEEDEANGRPQARREEDSTAAKRYEFIATAAMEIANRNPEGEIEKQLLAAAEHVPTPLMPLPPDVFTQALSFITKIASSATDEEIKAEAKRLLGKMLLHRPTAEPATVLAEAAKEEKRKRNKRLAKKNGEALGSASYNPPTNGSSEHVQKSDPMSCGDSETEESNVVTVAQAPPFAQSPMKRGKKYTVRPAASGGYGVFEVNSSICLQKHPTRDAAWDAADVLNQAQVPVAQEGVTANARHGLEGATI